MPKIDQIEKVTQNRVVKFFVDKLHYTYLGDLRDSENSNIMQERLYAYLTGKGGYSDKLSRRAIDELYVFSFFVYKPILLNYQNIINLFLSYIFLFM